MKKIIRKCATAALKPVMNSAPVRVNLESIMNNYMRERHPRLIDIVSRYVACEMIQGDYCEFGVFRGDTLENALHTIPSHYLDRIEQESGYNSEAKQIRIESLKNLRFFGFDSFEGLSTPSNHDGSDFIEGMYEASLEEVSRRFETNPNVHLVKGWVADTCTPENFHNLNINRVAVANLDVDLYEPTLQALTTLTEFLSPGAVLIFDDWFSHKASSQMGQQKVFFEWVQNEGINYTPYHKELWKCQSFIFHGHQRYASK